ncbi:glycosyltransferase [Paenibacillus sedimenti]|uniref:Glycosyltransferase family 1 protein n=1 Tax=Paenibacillus sedimenti TaxID=2770274 RepID=A0A926QJI5_9BACL|nr:glycosyltransferase [Paenibacillus sedimenti]MBD0381565.1 glycosyltransferase family 1 protein [Paenibacillus sedimenti]
MGKLKLLYSTLDDENYIHEYKKYFKSELSKQSNVEVRYITNGGNVKDILAELDFKPDFIYIDELFKNCKPIQGLNNINIPIGVMYHDLHSNQNKFRKLIKEYQPELIFVHYRDYFISEFPELEHKSRWLPHFVHNELYKDYHLKKDIDYLLLGATTEKYYPLRNAIMNKMTGKKGFVYHKHPGYRYFSETEKKTMFIGGNYAREISRSKIFFTDDLIYKYPIKKYFEVPACKTLLLASGSQELRDLGFLDEETFVEINQKNYYKKAKYYLQNEKERMKIAQQGYEMVHTRHTTEIRVKQFLEYISQALHLR